MSKVPKPDYGQYNDIGKTPLIGPWIARIGAIHDIWAVPCNTTPGIWALAAWHAFPRLAVLVTTPFWLAWKWQNLTRRTGHRGKKSGLQWLIEGEELEKADGRLVWKFFQITGDLVLKLEWYFMIVDVVTEFEYNWTSLVYAYSGCRHPGDLWCEGNGVFPRLHINKDTPGALPCAPGGVTGNMAADGYGPILRPGQAGAYAFDVHWSLYPKELPGESAKNVTFSVCTRNAFTKLGTYSQPPGADGKAHVQFFLPVDGDLEEGDGYLTVYEGDPGFFFIDDFRWSFNGFNSGSRGLDSVLPEAR